MFEDVEVSRDLVNLVVPQRGGLVATGGRQEPFRLVDGDGLVVAGAAEFFCDLQAAGRPDSTVRSYGLLCRVRHNSPYADALVMPRRPGFGVCRAVRGSA
jgi:hypothetical protein